MWLCVALSVLSKADLALLKEGPRFATSTGILAVNRALDACLVNPWMPKSNR